MMRNSDEKNTLLLIGVLALAVLPHVSRLPLWISVWCFLLWGYAYLAERYGWYRPNRFIRLLLTLAGVTAGLRTFGFAVGLDSGVGVLSILLGLKILEVRSHRDRMVTLFLAYFMIITTVLYSGSLPITLYMFVAVLLSTAVLIQINHPSGALAANLGVSSVLMVQALPIMVVLFFLFPRIQGSLFALPQKTAAKTGFSDRLTPGSISQLVRSSEIAFRAEFKGSVPAPDRLYWRGIVFWHYDGKAWTQGIEVPLPEASPAGKNVVEYTLTMEPHEKKWLFAMDLPVSVPDLAVMKADRTLVAKSVLKERIRYTVKSGDVPPSETLKQWETAALALPGNRNPRAAALAREWASTAGTAETIIETALEFFKDNGFVYTLNPPLLGQDPLDEFLFRYRKGYCEHYASAFVFLMRAAGIPARIVGGYLGGEINPYGDYLIVRQSDAHAWAEVWLPAKGWTRVDPTSAVAPERVEQGMTAALPAEDIERFFLLERFGPLYTYWRKIGLGWDALNTYWNRWVMGYTHTRQKALLSRLGIDVESWKGPLTVILVAVILIVFFIVLYYFWTNRKPVEKKDSIQRYYDVFCTKLEAIGLPRKPEQGPLDYARMIVSQRRELQENIREITSLYVSMRYGREKNEASLKNFMALVKNFNPQKGERI